MDLGVRNENALFDPNGRLRQLEFASAAAQQGRTIVGVRATDGIVLAAWTPFTMGLEDKASASKVFKINQ